MISLGSILGEHVPVSCSRDTCPYQPSSRFCSPTATALLALYDENRRAGHAYSWPARSRARCIICCKVEPLIPDALGRRARLSPFRLAGLWKVCILRLCCAAGVAFVGWSGCAIGNRGHGHRDAATLGEMTSGPDQAESAATTLRYVRVCLLRVAQGRALAKLARSASLSSSLCLMRSRCTAPASSRWAGDRIAGEFAATSISAASPRGGSGPFRCAVR